MKFCPGDLVMMAGPPGAGKSALALNYALAAKVPTLYVSMDMGPRLVMERVCAISTGDTVEKVSQSLSSPDGEEKYRGVLESVDHLYISYPSRPTLENLAKVQMAFMEVHGLPSDLMVVDNLMNMDSGQENEWSGLRDLCQGLHYFATRLGITVLLLHHINVGGIDLSFPAPENYIKGQVSELPAVILSVAKQEGKLLVAPVKNRHGKADHTGRTHFTLDYDEARQKISDFVPKPDPVQNRWGKHSETPDWLSRGVKDG